MEEDVKYMSLAVDALMDASEARGMGMKNANAARSQGRGGAGGSDEAATDWG